MPCGEVLYISSAFLREASLTGIGLPGDDSGHGKMYSPGSYTCALTAGSTLSWYGNVLSPASPRGSTIWEIKPQKNMATPPARPAIKIFRFINLRGTNGNVSYHEDKRNLHRARH